ncbi:hypothetical protein SAV31267_010670 [Streptomyces avermitilis]|uniref:Uncharacterized protein n=1 Tax=Streptomyces avermitilis TaxID=33903 RepID=A0A4D4MHP4_STRAX|nr:hypothetical protein SAV31267_010670 [Streptomyces avermitilis]
MPAGRCGAGWLYGFTVPLGMVAGCGGEIGSGGARRRQQPVRAPCLSVRQAHTEIFTIPPWMCDQEFNKWARKGTPVANSQPTDRLRDPDLGSTVRQRSQVEGPP